MIYLASPFSSPNKDIRDRRFMDAAQATARLIADGHHVFSPITYSAYLAETHGVEDHGLWMRFDFAMLERCDRLWILDIEGWQQSKGVKMEYEHAKRLGYGVWLLDPGTLTIERLDEWPKAPVDSTQTGESAMTVG